MKYLKNKWTVIIAVVIAVGVFAAFSLGHTSSPQYFTAKAEKGDIHDVVEATGTIDAVTTVQVGSQVSGAILKLNADFNTHVKKGQVVAEIDPSLFQGSLLQATADLQDARANAAAAKAAVEKAKATAAQTQADFSRTATLAKEGVMSQQQLDVSKANNDTSTASVSAAQAQLVQAEAQVSQKQAAVNIAKTNLDHTIIRSPIDGVVTNRTIDVGQTVAASFQAPNLFNIAQDLTKMRVYAKTDESDVGQIKVGQPVTFKVDAFPAETFQGAVTQIRMNPTTVQNVVTYDTVIEFANPQMKLFPGMTAYVTIPVASATGVVKVPNAALRFTPDLKPDQLKELAQKYGVPLAGGTKRSRNNSGTDASQAPAKAKPADVAVVWKMNSDKTLQPVQVKTGITDHTFTEVAQGLKGQLQPGDALVTASGTTAQKPAAGAGPGAPGMGRGLGR
jgi:HlyD family secretion protein